MSNMKEMAAQYRYAAAKLAASIEQHKRAGDLTSSEMASLYSALKETREVAHLLSGYYDVPRQESSITLQGLKAWRVRSDH